MAKYLALDKVANFFKIIRQHGGFGKSMAKILRMDVIKDGALVGTDKYGNKYFENPRYFYASNRWVEYSPKTNFDYDGSQIPAEWYGWMHYKTDLPPHMDGSRPKHKWMADHTENTSGTSAQYMPYSTTQPKVQPWVPKKSSR